MSSLADSLRARSQSRNLTSTELACFNAAADSAENRVLIDAAGEGLLATTPVHLASANVPDDLGLIEKGSVIFAPLLPPSSDPAWLEYWVSYEVTKVTPRVGNEGTAIVSLAFCAYDPSPPPLNHQNFTHSHGPDLILQNLPSHLVVSLAPLAMSRSRLPKRKSSSVTQGKPAPPSTPSAADYDDDEEEGEDVAQKPRLFKDNDGISRSYQPPHVASTKLVMTPHWRTMSLDRLAIMYPTNAGYIEDLDRVFWVQYREIPPSDVVDEDRRVMYKIARFDGANVSKKPLLTSRAAQWQWKSLDWSFLSIFDFVRTPVPLADLKRFFDDCSEWPRELICSAIEDWNSWASIRSSITFKDSWVNVRAWLRDTPHLSDASMYHHDGLHARAMVEALFFRFYAAVSSPSSKTNYAGISFSSPGAAYELMVAMDIDFVSNVITMNVLPHYAFRHPRTVAAQIIGNTTFFPASVQTHPSTPSTPSTPVTSSSPLPSKIPCFYHLASLLDLPGAPGCRYASTCPHLHPTSLSDMTASAARESAALPKVNAGLSAQLVQAIQAQANSFRS